MVNIFDSALGRFHAMLVVAVGLLTATFFEAGVDWLEPEKNGYRVLWLGVVLLLGGLLIYATNPWASPNQQTRRVKIDGP